MKLIAFLFLVPAFAWSVNVPLETFDQQKLEQLLRKIPSSQVSSENLQGFTRKHFVFPVAKNAADFKITCSSDFYRNSTIPSEKRCSLDVSDQLLTSADVVKVKVTDPAIVTQLFNAISYSLNEKKFYSNERLKAVALHGDFAPAFRYMFLCKKDVCDLTFTP